MLHDKDEVIDEAHKQLREEDFNRAVAEHKKHLAAKRGRFFSKRIRFQWPVRFDEHYQPLNRRLGDKGKTV